MKFRLSLAAALVLQHDCAAVRFLPCPKYAVRLDGSGIRVAFHPTFLAAALI